MFDRYETQERFYGKMFCLLFNFFVNFSIFLIFIILFPMKTNPKRLKSTNTPTQNIYVSTGSNID